ncbi:amidohydrolase family protein [Microbispora sp. NPDC046933]|uniref:amidohydrolase family protein n=1 Tax=Microbispora sp. NPDC046933 TaxID=3155618 RepID=UPI0033FEA13A
MIIDMHAHLAVPEAEELVQGAPGLAAEHAVEQASHSAHSLRVNREQLARVIPRMRDVRARLADMDAMGVDVQAVSPMPMHHYWAPPELAARFARTVNDGVAAHVAQAPDRLAGIGTVPLQHPELAVAELERALALGLRGVTVSTNVDGRELADPRHEPFWEAAAAHGVPVLIHPWGCTLGPRLAAHYLGNSIGQPVETTVALAHVICSGLLDRLPGLRLCAAHGGGYLPAFTARADHAWHNRPDARSCAEPPSAYLRRIWFDSLVYTAPALRALVNAASADRVVIGTDYPFDMGVDDPLVRLDSAGLGPADVKKIVSANALDLLGGAL